MTEGLEKFGKLPEHLEKHLDNIEGFKNEIRQLAEKTNDPHLREERFEETEIPLIDKETIEEITKIVDESISLKDERRKIIKTQSRFINSR